MKYIISIFIVSSLLITSVLKAQEKHAYTCSDGKTALYEKLFAFDGTKYISKSSYNYDLKYYRLEFEIDPAFREISGVVTSYFTVGEDNLMTMAFDLNHNGMTVDSVYYHTDRISDYSLSDYELTINYPSGLTFGSLDSVTVFYHGVPETNGFGSFEQTNHDGVPIIWTLSEPYGARDWWPCKQSLNDKIDSIDVYITNPEDYMAASNGLLVSETVFEGYKTAHWKHVHPITTYLIAIAVTNYEAYSDFVTISSGDEVEIVNYVFPEDLTYAQSNTPNILDVMQLYSHLFIPYPYKDEKYGHAQFSWGGGMEHQTMSFMIHFGHGLMAHELAHQWFGDYITCGSWEDIWLNEGFATYLDGMTHEHNLDDEPYFFNDWKEWRIGHITGSPDGSVFVDDTTNVSRIFSGRLSYSKGAMVLHMIRKKIGDDAFFQALKNYLNDPELAEGYARTTDLQYHLEQTYGSSLQEFLNDWFYGQGYPIYDIYYSQNEERSVDVTINQSQSHASVDFFEMDVPVKFVGISKDTLMIFNNISNAQTFSFQLEWDITSAMFDPEHDVISTNSSVLMVDTFDRNKFFINPNPARETINVSFLEKVFPEKVMIYDNYGNALKIFEIGFVSSYNFVFDISDLSSGMYVISFFQGGDIASKKFVKH